MREGWRLFEWWLKQQAAADHAWVMDLLWTNSISVHILGLALFCICFCIPANLLYVVKINLGACFIPCIVLFCLLWTNSIYAHILQPSSIFVFFLFSSHLKQICCGQTQSTRIFYTLLLYFFFRFQTNLLWINSICTHTWKILLFIFPFLYLYFLWTSCDQNQCACKY